MAKFEIKDGVAIIPKGTIEIPNDAFRNCKELTTVVIPDSVTSIGENAFYGCSSLTNITIGDSVTSLGWSAFYGCSALMSITIPDSVTSIEKSTFDGCSALKSIVVAEGNPKYDSRENCHAIIETATNKLIQGCSKTIIPASVTKIGDNAFRDCSSLTNITIPDCVTEIGYYTFSGCSALTEIVIPNNVSEIGFYAFSCCSALTEIVIPKNLTELGNYVFYCCTALTSVSIPEGVTEIGWGAFTGCSALTEIVIPSSVQNIGSLAFEGCSSLTNIVIPETLTKIRVHAFKSCSSLSSIVVAEGNPIYDSRENCNAIIETATNTLIQGSSQTIIPNSVTSIGTEAFYGCSSFKSILIPDSVTKIGYNAFYGCSALMSITIPDSVTSIEKSTFAGCSALTSIVVAEGNPKYDSRENCNAIIETATNTLILGCSQTNIPNSVKAIEGYAFSGCSALTEIVIPNNVTSFKGLPFFNCSSLNSIVVAEGNPTYDNCENCHAIIETATKKLIRGCSQTIIPDTVTSIGEQAFDRCSSLTEIVIPKGVKKIESVAFYICSNLTTITLPAGVNKIAEDAFTRCDQLTTIYVPAKKTDYYLQRLPKALHSKIVELAPEKKGKKSDGDVEIKFTKLTLEQIALLDKDLHLEVYINAEDYEDVTEFDPYQGFDFYFNKGMISFGAGFYKIPYNELEIPVCAYPKITTDLGEPIQCEIDKFIGQLVVGLMWHSRYVLDDDYTRALEKYKVPIYAYALKDADSCIISEGNRFEDFYISQLRRFATV